MHAERHSKGWKCTDAGFAQLSLNMSILHAIIVGRHLYHIVLRKQHGYNGMLPYNKEKIKKWMNLEISCYKGRFYTFCTDNSSL